MTDDAILLPVGLLFLLKALFVHFEVEEVSPPIKKSNYAFDILCPPKSDFDGYILSTE